jgi:hypothetical protein
MSDSDPDLTYLHTIKKLQELNLGILHLIETAKSASDSQSLAAKARKVFSGMLVLNDADEGKLVAQLRDEDGDRLSTRRRHPGQGRRRPDAHERNPPAASLAPSTWRRRRNGCFFTQP